jgi:methionyl-tRNA synthetase
MWQAMLMSAGLAPSEKIFIHGFITADGQKMSKSLGNVINPFDLVNKYSTDALRYFLLREITPGEDGDFTYDKFEKRYNDDLASGLGNLLARVLALLSKGRRYSFRPEEARIKDGYLEKKAVAVMKDSQELASNFRFNEALSLIWSLISMTDKYIEDKKPWQEKDDNEEVLETLMAILKQISEALQIFIPETAQAIKIQLIDPKKKESLFPRL